jgi:hypothetical protein
LNSPLIESLLNSILKGCPINSKHRRTEQAVDRATKRTPLPKKIDKPMLVFKGFHCSRQ